MCLPFSEYGDKFGVDGDSVGDVVRSPSDGLHPLVFGHLGHPSSPADHGSSPIDCPGVGVCPVPVWDIP